MRKLAALVLLFSAQVAFACPDLSGTFTCTYQDGQSEVVTITQTKDEATGFTTYNYGQQMIVADNVAKDISDQTLREAQFTAWCDDTTTLKALMTGKYFNGGEFFGDLNMNLSFSLAGSDLRQVTVGSLVSASETYPLDSDMTCTRNP